MDFEISGKKAIVCAASKGLGFACAKRLASEGVDLAISARNSDALEKAADQLRKTYGGMVLAIPADMASERDRAMFYSVAVKDLGNPDILINNAGGPPAGPTDAFSRSDYLRALELNLLNAADMCQKAVPAMKKKGWGRIVNLTSIAVKQPIPNLGLSNMARAGLTGYAKTLAIELAPFGITVNCICPGTILTDRIRELGGPDVDPNVPPSSGPLADLIRDTAMRRFGDPDDVGALAAFLCSNRASYITGASISVDGGAFRGLF